MNRQTRSLVVSLITVVIVTVMLGVIQACAGQAVSLPGGAYRTGYTDVPPGVMVSQEQYHRTGIGFGGEGWTMIYVGGDEFVYCIASVDADMVGTFNTARANNQAVVLFYQDGGGTTAGSCTPSQTSETAVPKVRVTHVEVKTPQTDLSQEYQVISPTSTAPERFTPVVP